jgi:hypothetical protein
MRLEIVMSSEGCYFDINGSSKMYRLMTASL